jgi:hypothetical protein
MCCFPLTVRICLVCHSGCKGNLRKACKTSDLNMTSLSCGCSLQKYSSDAPSECKPSSPVKTHNSLSHAQSRKSRGEPGVSMCRHILTHFSRARVTWAVRKRSLKVQTDSSRSTYYLGSSTYNFDLRLCKVWTACEATSALLAFCTFQSCYLSSASYASSKKILLRLQ